ncbi:MAG: hypothetical protein HON90_11575 [Halobacteriovoraceae bacterium]|jgi:cell fate regulator YaaT (PSP1 superfamily)|nr:hypothetical protein [Halobacteriovoraceae bacterium]
MTQIQEVEDKSTEQNNKVEEQSRKKNKFAVKEDITEDNCKFHDGQVLKFVRVRFPGHAKSYPFLIGQRNLFYGQKVMAMSDRGMAVGYINSFEYEIAFAKNMLPLRTISKMATEEDIQNEKENYKKQKEIETTCQNLIDKNNLSMNLTHVEFTQFGKKVVFYFIAPARVDFRGLVKDLVSELRLRIELRQISVRDRAASQGALGPCGRELCCSSFLSKYGNVSVKMAKNQNLTLNYSKLNGVCGQLKCCLQYEDEVYSQKRKKMPQEGSLIQTHSGDSGKVRKIYLLTEQFDLLTEKGRVKRFTADQFKKSYKEGEYKFPHRFDTISDETGTVQGLSELKSKQSRQFERDIEKIGFKAKKYAVETIEGISDYLPARDRTEDKAEIEKQQLLAETKVEKFIDLSTSVVEEVQETAKVTAPVKSSNKPYRKNNRHNNRNRRPKNNNNSKANKSKE